jgi:hypothetical protein
VADPLRELSRGRAFDRQQLSRYMTNGDGEMKSGVTA